MTQVGRSSRPLSSSSVEPLTSEPEPLVCEAPREVAPPPIERGEASAATRALLRQGRVELCGRPVEAGAPGSVYQTLSELAAKVGLDHRWLKTSSKEAGMGPAGGGAPEGSQMPVAKPTTLNDHAGQALRPDASCKPVENVDEACVNERLRYGTPTGPWLPTVNDCHDVVRRIVDECTPPPEADRQLLDSKEIP